MTDAPQISVIGPEDDIKLNVAKFLEERSNLVRITRESILSIPNNSLWYSPHDQYAQLLTNRLSGDDCVQNGYILHDIPSSPDEARALVRMGILPSNLVLLHRGEESSKNPKYVEFTNTLQAIRAIDQGNDEISVVEVEVTSDTSISQLGEAVRVSLGLDIINGGQEDEEEEEREEIGFEVASELKVRPVSAASHLSTTAPQSTLPNAFSITLFCIDEAFDSRAAEFLLPAFHLFSDRDYCIVTVPHNVGESQLLTNFTQIASKPLSTFSHTLYVFHRDSLTIDLQVKRLEKKDRRAAKSLLYGMENERIIFNGIENAMEELHLAPNQNPSKIAFGVWAQDQIVGLCTLSTKQTTPEGIAQLNGSFRLTDYLTLAHHSPEQQIVLEHYVINPIFVKRNRFVLKELFRQCNKTCMYYLLRPENKNSPILDQFVQIHPRNRTATLPLAPNDSRKLLSPLFPCSLNFLSRKLLSEPKITINSRVIVVGASDTGLSCLETLLMVPYLNFTCITLVSMAGVPDGVETPGLINSGPYNSLRLQQLCLDRRIRIIKGRFSALDREKKSIELIDGTILFYDYLVLATGRQDQTMHSLGMELISSPDGFYSLGSDRDVFELQSFLRSRASQQVVVYGTGLHAFSAIQAVIARKPAKCSVLFVCPYQNPQVDEKVQQDVTKWFDENGVKQLYGSEMISVDADNGKVKSCKIRRLDDTGEGQTLKCQVVVCASTPDIDPYVFNALHNASIVYDGSIIIDNKFRTNDPQIYAAGPVAKVCILCIFV